MVIDRARQIWFELHGGLADGVAEVSLVDAVELVCGREVHGLDDVLDGFAVVGYESDGIGNDILGTLRIDQKDADIV